MIPLFSEVEFKNAQYKDFLLLQCKGCNKKFSRTKKKIMDYKNPNGHSTGDYCSPKCSTDAKKVERINKKCDYKLCQNTIFKTINELNYNKSHFCSSECRIEHFSTKKVCKCNECGIEFKRELHKIKDNKSGIFYCGQVCLNNSFKKKIIVNCRCCNKSIERVKKENQKNYFCNQNCSTKFLKKEKYLVNCLNCKIDFLKKHAEIIRTDNHFCCRKCSQEFNNYCSRSKLELYLEPILINKYPELKITFNVRNIKSFNTLELDIYIESLKIAFELSGPTHYKEIYKSRPLFKQIDRDQRKIYSCVSNNINLHIIDVTSLQYNSIKKSKPYLDFICNTIDFYLNKKV